MLRAVLLDLYGTLVEPSWPVLIRGRGALAERLGIDAAAAQRAWERTHLARMTGRHGSLEGDLAAILAAAGDGRNEPFAPAMLRELAADERHNWAAGVRVIPDAVPAIGALRAIGCRIAIVTNASAEAAHVVDALELRPLVDDVISSFEEGVLKPDLIHVALWRLGVGAAETLLVDDEPEQLNAAAAMGLQTVLVRRTAADGSAPATAIPYRQVSDLRLVAGLLRTPEPARRT